MLDEYQARFHSRTHESSIALWRREIMHLLKAGCRQGIDFSAYLSILVCAMDLSDDYPA
jgi:hypothetical protein